MAEVTDLGQERKKRQKKEDSFSQVELFAQVLAKMHKSNLGPRKWPAFPRKFHLLEDSAGRKTVLEEVPNKIVVYRTEEVIPETITRYCHEQLGHVPGTDISYKQADACKKLWWSLTDPLPTPPPAVTERSDPRLTFNRLAFDAPVKLDALGRAVMPKTPPKHFMSLMSRCSESLAVECFIGSLFFDNSDRQQYLYLYGEGQDGKGSLLRFLFLLLTDACQSVQPKTKGDRFWNFSIYGKRLVLFADVEAPEYFTSAEFKSLTGNDPLYFEAKLKMGFTAIPTCKIIVASNHQPVITGQKSDLRRLIYASMEQVDDRDLVPNFEALLMSEAAEIVTWCKSRYLKNCPTHGPIPTTVPDDLAAESEESYTEIFEEFFEKAPELAFLSAASVRKLLREHGIKSNREVAKLKAVWKRRYGVIAENKKGIGRVYSGLRRKTVGASYAS